MGAQEKQQLITVYKTKGQLGKMIAQVFPGFLHIGDQCASPGFKYFQGFPGIAKLPRGDESFAGFDFKRPVGDDFFYHLVAHF